MYGSVLGLGPAPAIHRHPDPVRIYAWSATKAADAARALDVGI